MNQDQWESTLEHRLANGQVGVEEHEQLLREAMKVVIANNPTLAATLEGLRGEVSENESE